MGDRQLSGTSALPAAGDYPPLLTSLLFLLLLPLLVLLAVLNYLQALVQASADLRMAGRQLSGANKLPVLLWVVNQAAQADAAVGVAVWVRLLLPQLLGLIELPSSSGSSSKSAKAAVAGGDQAQLLVPLDVPSQKACLQYLAGV